MPPVKFAIAPRFRRKSLVSGWKLVLIKTTYWDVAKLLRIISIVRFVGWESVGDYYSEEYSLHQTVAAPTICRQNTRTR